MRTLLFALVLATSPVADACSVSGTPAANVFTKGQPPGHQPFSATSLMIIAARS